MILETKLSFPQPKAGALLRTALIERIKNNLDKKLILITADAGYGKTTLLGQLVKTARLPAVFYHMDQGDSDLVTFYSYLIAGMEKLAPGVAVRSAGLLKQGSQISGNYELLMGTLINELLEKRKEELFLVLDDYQHLAENSPVHQALDFFIDHMPESVHVIIASRGTVLFADYAKWFAKQNAFKVCRNDLRFDEDEAAELLVKIYGQALKDTDLKSLLARTEGWITAIQLILQRSGRMDENRTIDEVLAGCLECGQPLFEYFIGDVFAQEPQPVRDFLINTSGLDLVAAGACDVIFNRQDSEIMLRRLERGNLFISRIGPAAYSYHPLFREFLQRQITDGADWQRLHLLAGGYYEKSGMVEPAVEHYLRAGNYQQAVRAMTDAIGDIKQKCKYSLLENWLQRMPEEVLASRPTLLVCMAEIHNYNGRHQEARNALSMAERLSKAAGDADSFSRALYQHAYFLTLEGKYREALIALRRAARNCPSRDYDRKGSILNEQGVIYMDLGDLRKAGEYLKKAAEIFRNRDHFAYINVLSHSAVLRTRRGDMKQAFEQYQKIINAVNAQYIIKIGFIFGNAARIAVDLGRDHWAEQTLSQGWELCRKYQDPWSHCALHYGFGSLYIQKSRWDSAKEHLEQAWHQASELNYLALEIGALRDLAQLYRYTGDWENARRYLTMARQKLGASGDSLNDAYLLTAQGQLETAQGKFDQAEATLKAGFKLSAKYGLNSGMLKAQLALAEISLIRGNHKKASRLLGQALKISRDKGYEGVLIRELRNNPALANLGLGDRTKNKFPARLKSLMTAETGRLSGTVAVKVRLFGSLKICLPDGREIPVKWRSRKVASLLAYLIINRKRLCERDELMTAIWPDKNIKQAEQDLRAAIYWLKENYRVGCRARSANDLYRHDIVLHQQRGYRLNPLFDVNLDTEEFADQWRHAISDSEAGNDEQCFAACRRCLELYQDDFLSNLADLWCEDKREAFEKMRLSCLKKAAEHNYQANDIPGALALYEKCLDIEKHRDSLDEAIHTGYWKALQARGWYSRIKKDYERYCKQLKNSGERAGASFEELYRTILETKRQRH